MTNRERSVFLSCLLGAVSSLGCASDPTAVPAIAPDDAGAVDAKVIPDDANASAEGGPVRDAAVSHDGASADGAPSATCTPDCKAPYLCCNGSCVDPRNDPHNCGSCGNECKGDNDFCNGTDVPPTPPHCTPQIMCLMEPVDGGVPSCPGYSTPGLCCEYQCCARDEICCLGYGPTGTGCFKPTPDHPTCPPLDPHYFPWDPSN